MPLKRLNYEPAPEREELLLPPTSSRLDQFSVEVIGASKNELESFIASGSVANPLALLLPLPRLVMQRRPLKKFGKKMSFFCR